MSAPYSGGNTMQRLRFGMAPGNFLGAAVLALCVVAAERHMPGYSATGFVALALVGALSYATVAVMLDVCDSRAFVARGLHLALARLAPKRSATGRI